jgi:hypothetical protein
MNPEFRRNVWLELSPRRLMTMTAVLVLIFFAAALSGNDWTPPAAATILYYFIVVIWGARNAALSVVGEIRDRTWDFQRLSSLGAGEMTWGKLFGATIFNWYGGALCLLVILAYRVVHEGPLGGLIAFVYFVVIGLIAQSVALLASLVAAMRRQSHTRLEVFAYQMIGLIAALVAYDVWQMADPAGSLLGHQKPAEFITWWDHAFDARAFLLVSLAAFAGWTLFGCYREMRLELKMENGPFVWLAFLVFMGLYVAGLNGLTPKSIEVNSVTVDVVAERLMLAGLTFVVITYVMVLLEPKDLVLYRRMGADLANRRFGGVAWALQGWMMSCKAAFLVGIALIVWLANHDAVSAATFVGAGLGFLLRDVGIFVLLQSLPGRRRGDFAALVALFTLYVLLPSIADGLGLKQAMIVFYPQVSTPVWLSPLVAWTEALLIAGLAVGRIATGAKQAVATAAAA